MTSFTELGHCTSNTAVEEYIELPDSTTKIVDNNNNKIIHRKKCSTIIKLFKIIFIHD